MTDKSRGIADPEKTSIATQAPVNKNTGMSPMGLGSEDHCAGEGQQQFSSQS
jgi:hypothetical protein